MKTKIIALLGLLLAVVDPPEARSQSLEQLVDEIRVLEAEIARLPAADDGELESRRRRVELEEERTVLERTLALRRKYPDRTRLVDGFGLGRDVLFHAAGVHGGFFGSDRQRLHRTVLEEMDQHFVEARGTALGLGSSAFLTDRPILWETDCDGDPERVALAPTFVGDPTAIVFLLLPKNALRLRDVAELAELALDPRLCVEKQEVECLDPGVVCLDLSRHLVTVRGVIDGGLLPEIVLRDWELVRGERGE